LIRLYVGWAKSFVVLFDGDAEGKKQKQRYEAEFGPVVDGRCLLLPDLCGDQSVKRAEQLLDDDDQQNIIDAIFATSANIPAPKKALSQAILELYARRQAVPLGPASSERLTSLLDRLREVLAAEDPLSDD
jgi:hypothetical protein